MRIKIVENAVMVWLSASDTYAWAHRSGAAWPGSTLSGNRLFAAFDSNGLYDFTVNGRDDEGETSADELSAICADHLARNLPKNHPAYDVAVGQHIA